MSYVAYVQVKEQVVGCTIKADRVRLLDDHYVFYDNSGNIVACFFLGQFLYFLQVTGDPPWSIS